LAATLVALAALFSAVSLFQRLTHGHLLASDVERANAYTSYFRVTSLFRDPSVFGRHVVIAIGVLLVAIWLGRIRFWAGATLIAFLWTGLLFAYSQSSFAALFAVGVAVSFVLCGPKLLRGSDRLGRDRRRRVGCPRHGSGRCWQTCPRRVRRRILLSLAVLGLLVAGAGAAFYLKSREHPQGKLDTQLKGVSVETVSTGPIKTPKHKGHHLVDDKRCWLNFGGNPQRTLARPSIDIGLPLRHFWVTGLGSYIEYPPSYCGGILYVNTFGGKTVALNSHNGHVIWQRRGGRKPSTPAIAGPRLIVSSHDGTVTAYDRFNGRRL